MKLTFAIFAGILASSLLQALNGQSFDQWFDEGVMRVDLVFSGSAKESSYAFESLRKEAFYSGSRTYIGGSLRLRGS